MSPTWEDSLAWLSAQPECLVGMQRGLEKEALRVTEDGWLARTPHPAALGSALTHPQLTTDYSEALLELITPPCDSVSQALGWLDDLHRYVVAHLGSERLWVSSMPCKLGPDAEIPLAQYGSSAIGRMKTLYRHGLGLRYGRRMQTIAGIHYNLSFPDTFWFAWQQHLGDRGSLAAFRSQRSMGLLREFQRHSGLLLFLLGASPAVCSTFLEGRAHGLQSLPSGTLYLPYATSLRMSPLGYQNDAQSGLHVSLNSLVNYTEDLDRAIRTPYAPYTQMGVKNQGVFQQLSDSLLQIENEYYGLIRPKSVARPGERPTQALARTGVAYIEMRCVDLDPQEPLGISRDTAHFLEVFALACVLRPSAPLTSEESARLARNQLILVHAGRDPDVEIETASGPMLFRRWAAQELGALMPVAAILDASVDSQAYSRAVAHQIAKLKEPELTGSAAVLKDLAEYNGCYFSAAMAAANRTRDYFLSRPLSEPQRQALAQTAQASLAAQHRLEADPDQQGDFGQFLSRYLAAPLVVDEAQMGPRESI